MKKMQWGLVMNGKRAMECYGRAVAYIWEA